MFRLNRITALILAFCLGFSVCAGSITFIGMAAISKFRLRDLEKHGINLPDEAFMGTNYEVDLLSLSLYDAYKELINLKEMGDELTINRLKQRYDLKLDGKLGALLSEDTRNMPLSQLFGEAGFHKMLSSLYIGNIEKYECHAIDSTEKADPALGKTLTRWYDPVGEKYITGIGATIAYFTLEDFASGGINVDSVLHGIVLADVLGYTYELDENENKIWFDGNGQKVTGVMAVFADCTIDEVSGKINTVPIGDIIGYFEKDGMWYETKEDGTTAPVSKFMGKIANSNITNIGGVFQTLQIGDIVDIKEDTKGIFSIIPADTQINQIDQVVNQSIENSPIQFFINQGMIAFDAAQMNNLDTISKNKGEIEPFGADSEEYKKYYKDVANLETDGDGNYLVPIWRTKSLKESFSYIVVLLTPSIP